MAGPRRGARSGYGPVGVQRLEPDRDNPYLPPEAELEAPDRGERLPYLGPDASAVEILRLGTRLAYDGARSMAPPLLAVWGFSLLRGYATAALLAVWTMRGSAEGLDGLPLPVVAMGMLSTVLGAVEGGLGQQMAIYAALERYKTGARVSPMASLAFGLSRLGPAVWIGLCRPLLFVVGMVLLVVPGVLALIRLAVAPAVVALEPEHPPIRRSLHLTHLLEGRVLRVVLAGGAPGLLIVALGRLLSQAGPSPLLAEGMRLGLGALNLAVQGWSALVTVALFLWAREAQAAMGRGARA